VAAARTNLCLQISSWSWSTLTPSLITTRSPKILASLTPIPRKFNYARLCSPSIWPTFSQKRFKKFVELGGFALVGGAVIEAGGSDAAHATPAKPKARGKKPAATPMSAKKRKVKAMTPCEDEDEEGDIKHQTGSEQED
jgi:hypothetical protein